MLRFSQPRTWSATIPVELYRLTGILALFFTTVGITMPITSLFLEKEVGLSYSQIGVANATSALAGLGGAWLVGRLSDGARFGRRPWVVGALLVVMAGYATLSQLNTFLLVLVTMAVIGAGSTGYNTVANAMSGDLVATHPNRGLLLSLSRTFGSLTFALGALLAGWLTIQGGLRAPLMAAAITCLIGALVGLTLHERPATETDATVERVPTRELLMGPRGRFLLVAFFWSAALLGAYSMFSNYLVSLGLTAANSGQWQAYSALLEVPLMPLAGWCGDRWGRRIVMMSGLLAYVVSLAGLVIAPLSGGLLISQTIRAWAIAGFLSGSVAYAMEIVPRRQRGQFSGYFQIANGIGAVVGGWWGGLATDTFGFVTMFLSCGVLASVGVVIIRRLPPVALLRQQGAGVE